MTSQIVATHCEDEAKVAPRHPGALKNITRVDDVTIVLSLSFCYSCLSPPTGNCDTKVTPISATIYLNPQRCTMATCAHPDNDVLALTLAWDVMQISSIVSSVHRVFYKTEYLRCAHSSGTMINAKAASSHIPCDF